MWGMATNRKYFFDTVRASLFGGKLVPLQVAGMTAILDEWDTGKWQDDLDRLAYMLATAFHETARTMQPIEEYGKGKGRPYGKCLCMSRKPYTDTKNLFYGRGLVQLTWYENYRLAGDRVGVDLIRHPEKACELDLAVKIMFHGMFEGWFTGKKLSDYFSAAKTDWANARRIINGLDRAELVASYGRQFRAALRPG